MDVFTLYAGQGDLAAVRANGEALIIDAHMPDCDTVKREQIEQSLGHYLSKCKVRGLILTGLDDDHASPAGVDSILTHHRPDWVMYPTYYKDTEAATLVFKTIDRHAAGREGTASPLRRVSVHVNRTENRFLTGLTRFFSLELFSPHMGDMDSSNNSSIVLKVTGLDPTGFRYLVTGDTETGRWDNINRFFGSHLASDVLSAPHHGSRNGVNAESLLLINPNTVLISAGVDSSYGHPDPKAVQAYRAVAKHVFTTNAEEGTCLFTRRSGSDFQTVTLRHLAVA